MKKTYHEFWRTVDQALYSTDTHISSLVTILADILMSSAGKIARNEEKQQIK